MPSNDVSELLEFLKQAEELHRKTATIMDSIDRAEEMRRRLETSFAETQRAVSQINRSIQNANRALRQARRMLETGGPMLTRKPAPAPKVPGRDQIERVEER